MHPKCQSCGRTFYSSVPDICPSCGVPITKYEPRTVLATLTGCAAAFYAYMQTKNWVAALMALLLVAWFGHTKIGELVIKLLAALFAIWIVIFFTQNKMY